jgi:hypothetical protein
MRSGVHFSAEREQRQHRRKRHGGADDQPRRASQRGVQTGGWIHLDVRPGRQA